MLLTENAINIRVAINTIPTLFFRHPLFEEDGDDKGSGSGDGDRIKVTILKRAKTFYASQKSVNAFAD